MDISLQSLFLVLASLTTMAGFLIVVFSRLERKQKLKRKSFVRVDSNFLN